MECQQKDAQKAAKKSELKNDYSFKGLSSKLFPELTFFQVAR